MNEPDWIDRLLQDAIKKDRSHDFEEFEEEFEALKVYLKSRNSRAVIVAAACLAVSSCALNGATKIQRIDDRDAERLQHLVDSLVAILPADYFTYLPATIAGLLLREEK